MKLKRVISLMLVVLLTIGLIGCRGDGEVDDADKADVGQSDKEEKGQKDDKDAKEKEDEKEPEEGGKLFDKPFKISLLYADGASWPFQEDWFVKETIEERTGVTLDVLTATAGSEFREKIHLGVASQNMPDIIGQRWMGEVREYAMDDVYLQVDSNIDKMPNFNKWSEIDTNRDYIEQYRMADGNLYSFPILGPGLTNTRFWFYRKDIFDKHGLSYPKNADELYDVVVKLKEWEGPDCYPFTYRSSGIILGSWEILSVGIFYDESADEWIYGRIDNRYRDFVQFHRRLYTEGLMLPKEQSIDLPMLVDMILQDEVFITNDYLEAAEKAIKEGESSDIDFELAYMPPLNATSRFTATETGSFTITKAGRDDETIDNLIKYMDWLYSEEAEELLSWGEEGLTYTVDDGKRQLVGDYRAEFGIGNTGFAGAFDKEALINTYPEMCVVALNEQPQYEVRENLASYLPLTEDERTRASEIISEVNSYASKEASKFMYGEQSMEAWGDYVRQIESMGLEEALDIYRTAHKRYLDAKK